MKRTFSNRTKRRKVQRELEVLDYPISDSISENLSNTFQNTCNTSRSLTFPNSISNTLNVDFDCNWKPSKQLILENDNIPNPNLTIENTLTFNDDKLIDIYKSNYNLQEDILRSLAQWAVDYNVPQNTVNKLLEILKFKADLSYLPKNCRTLLRSNATKVLNLREIKPNGIYYHFGLRNGILRYSSILPLNEHIIQIAIGIDGLPISKSSSGQFWPILAYIVPFHKYVFPVGIFYGNKKPDDSNDYLTDFIAEVLEITTSGIWINNELKNVKIKMICCDAPAKAFILRVKGHSGYSSCTRCTQEGIYLNHVCFPYNESGYQKRNHDNYVLMMDEPHHVSPIVSCLVLIPDVDIINLFPLDYMHLVLLGITKRLIILWLYNGPPNVRLPSWKSRNITANLLKLRTCITNDFSRKPRGIEEVNRFKATELRQFLLYTGPIALKNIISEDCYQHFLILSIAMRILLSKDHIAYVDYAHQLLEYFVKMFQQIYGIIFMSHNVHGLLHLADDYKIYGPLDNSSCFPFENYMKYLKRMLRKHDKPLQQVVRRYTELCNNEDIKYHNQDQINFTTHEPDCFILSKRGEVIKITDILLDTNTVVGRIFLIKDNFYIKPLKSSKLDIFIVKNISKTTKQWKISEIKKKLVVFNFENDFIAMPVIR